MAKTIFASNELGSRITIVATHDISRGEIVSINGIIGVATNPIRTGKSGTLLTEGIFEVEKIDSEMELLVGSNVYLQYGLATNVQNMTYLGKVVEDSDPGETSVRIKISTGTQNSIVSLTLAELETLAFNSELKKGLQYDVTDKGWLVYALSHNLCRLLTLNVKEILPPYILREGSPISLTLAELQALQFTDAPAPTGITIIPDAVGANPRIVDYFIAFYHWENAEISLYSDTIPVTVGDDTDVLFITNKPPLASWAQGILLMYEDSGDILFNSEGNGDQCSLQDFQSITAYPFLLKQLRNPLPLGQQYYVTDKEWLLYVDKPTVLKPVSGRLHLFNGQELPEGVEPDSLTINSGVLTETLELLFPVTPGYIVQNVLVFDVTGDFSDQGYILLGAFVVNESNIIDSFSGNTIIDSYIGLFPRNSAMESMSVYSKFVLKFNAIGDPLDGLIISVNYTRCSTLEIPLPIPQILSAETTSTADILITTNQNLISNNLDGFALVKINGVAVDDLTYLVTWPESPQQISIQLDSVRMEFGNVITISIPENTIKNVWGGLLPEVIDYPVINNVPESE